MASYGEIQKLEQRHRENPKGRTFAPLADAYRKAGEVARALELVRGGLLQHPDYVSGHIVLGRCLVDHGDDAEARQAFERVLSLDPENVIALRMLSDVAERAGATDEARQWLEQLLEIDPNNTDAEEALQRVRTAQGPVAAPEPPAEPAGAPEAAAPVEDWGVVESAWEEESEIEAEHAPPEEPSPLTGGAVGEAPPSPRAAEEPAADLPIERASESLAEVSQPEPEAAATPPEDDVLELEQFDGQMDFSSVADAEIEVPGIEAEEQPVTEIEPEEIPRLEGLAGTQYESAMFEPPAGPLEAVPPEQEPPPEREAVVGQGVEEEVVDEPAGDLPAWNPETPEDEAAPQEWAAPEPWAAETPMAAAEDASDDELGRRESALADLPVILPEEGETGGQGAGETAEDVAAAQEAGEQAPPEEDALAVDRRALEEAEPVVTETMAELLVSQGYIEEARRVYRALLARRPGDALLSSRLASLEPVAGVAKPDELGVGRMFQELVAARPGEHERPRTSLEKAFGGVDEGPMAEGHEGEAEAVASEPEQEPERGAPTQAAPDRLSLDQIFGEGPSEAPAASPTDDEPAGETDQGGFSFDAFFSGDVPPSEPSPREPGPADEDVDDFHAWLKGLKS